MSEPLLRDPRLVKPLIVSWTIDAALALALVAAVLQGGRLIERLDVIAGQVIDISKRVEVLESHPMPTQTRERVTVLEQRANQHDRVLEALKVDLVNRLDRIETKVDDLR